MRRAIIASILFFSLLALPSYAQKYSEYTLRSALDSLSEDHPGLNNSLQLNVSSLQLSELLNSVALENNLNISVDPGLNQVVSYNFFNAQVKDMLVFLYLNFDLEYDFIGSIISVRKRKKQEPKPVVRAPKVVDAKYNSANTFLSLNLRNDTLWKVTEEITKISGRNIVVEPDVRNNLVNAYLLNRPFDQVIDMFGMSNGLEVRKEDDYYVISKGQVADNQTNGNRNNRNNQNSNNPDLIITKNPIGTIDVKAKNVNLSELIQAAANETQVHYVVYSDIQGKANLDLTDVRFDELVSTLFTGTNYSIKQNNDVYIIGENSMEGIRTTRLIRLENRTIESVKDAIPKDMLSGIDVKEFVELNALIVTGGQVQVDQLAAFVSEIDVVVPMVQIDVMLLFSEKSSQLNTGIKAGIKDQPTTTQGDIFPALDVELGSESINNILNAITGFGFVNLGQVTENFYVSLQALESNNVISIESTPKISTLNGHEANISIGETTYYQETQVNVQTSVTNQGVLQSRQWKSIDANLSVNIKPFVSADEHVTLTITVEQDDFSGKVDPSSPPNITTQTFESVVRVKNGEMILLGGLDKKKKSDSGSGVPFLSRVPVLKWFFSSREKDKEKSKMHILIRPTVTY